MLWMADGTDGVSLLGNQTMGRDNEIRDTTRKKTAIPPSGTYVDGDIWERDEGCVFVDIFLELNGWTREETQPCRYVG